MALMRLVECHHTYCSNSMAVSSVAAGMAADCPDLRSEHTSIATLLTYACTMASYSRLLLSSTSSTTVAASDVLSMLRQSD
jgi:hypothetical protein